MKHPLSTLLTLVAGRAATVLAGRAFRALRVEINDSPEKPLR